MKREQIKQLTSMPATSPTIGRDKVRCIDREFLVIDYETDMEALREVVPEPLAVMAPIVKFEVIRMSDFRGLGSFTESGQVIPVQYQGQDAAYVHQMYLDNFPAIAGGREVWGFPKKYANPCLFYDSDTVVGTVDFGRCRVAQATMAYKREAVDTAVLAATTAQTPNFLLKIIPDADNTPMLAQLVRYFIEDIEVKEAWTGPAGLELFDHALAPLKQLPVRKVLKGTHFIADLTLGWGEVEIDYMK